MHREERLVWVLKNETRRVTGGFFFLPRRWATALLETLSGADTRMRAADNARRLYEQRYQATEVAKQMDALFRKLRKQ